MEALFYLLVGLLFITLIGHGFWVLAALFFRAIGLGSSTPVRATHLPTKTCRLCNHVLYPDDVRCPACGELRKTAGQLADLRTTLRQLRAFQTQGLISEAEYERLAAHIEQKQQQVRNRPSPVREEPPAKPSAPVPEEEILVALAVSEPEAALPSEPAESRSEPRPIHQPAPPRPPRRTLAEWMAAFMEERNILWGELIGGLLMVGCSIALVFSLWRTLEEHLPYFPFLILAGLTFAIFGAGQYTLHHWKLTSTSRGLLVIAALLVPLNFLMLAAVSQGPAGGSLEVATKILASTAFFWMVNRLVLTILPNPDNPSFSSLFLRPMSFVRRPSLLFADSLLLPLAMVLGSASQLPVKRLLEPALPGGSFMFLGSWAVGLFGAGVGGALGRRLRQSNVEEKQAESLLIVLGLASFALVMSLGFLGFWIVTKGDRGNVPIALEQMSYLIMQAGAPILAVGLFVRERTRSAETKTGASYLLVTGTMVALVGMLIMLAAVFLAWPNPIALIAVSFFNFAVLTLAAFYFRLPVGHAFALVCLTIGCMTTYHLGAGHLSGLEREQWAGRLTELAWSQLTGVALLALFLASVAVAEGLAWLNRHGDSIYYKRASWVIAFVSLAIVAIDPLKGIPGPESEKSVYLTAFSVYGAYVLSALTLSRRWAWNWLDHVGAVLILVTTIWGMKWQHSGEYPLWATAFATEALLFSVLETSWWFETILAIILVLSTTVLGRRAGLTTWHTVNAFLLAATTFVQGWRWRSRGLSWLGSGLVLTGIGHVLIARLPDWFPQTEFSTPLLVITTLLGHAAVVQIGGLAIRLWRKDDVFLFAIPLGESALVTMSLAVPVLLFDVQPSELAIRAGFCLWLAVLWLASAIIERRRQVFALFQATLSVAVLFGVSQFLVDQEWLIDRYPQGFLDPRSLQMFGLGLTGLSLAWAVARILLRSNPRMQSLFSAVRPGFDRVQLYVLVAVQALLIAVGVLPGILSEMAPAGGVVPNPVHFVEYLLGYRAWLWLAALAVVFIVWLWESRTALNQTGMLTGLLVLAILASGLYAGTFAAEQATASALRWDLAVCFLVVSVLLILRTQLAALATTLRLQAPLHETADLLRGILVLATAFPVVGLTVWMALEVFAGQSPRGADAASFFARIGSTASHIVPLVLVMIGLTSHAFRERSAGFAFAGGLVANMITMGGYALGVIQAGFSLGEAEYVAILQMGTMTSAGWALGWQAVLYVSARRPVAVNEAPASDSSRSLIQIQSFLGVVGMALLTLLPVPRILFEPAATSSDFLHQAGSTLGWLALVTSTSAALGYLRRIGSDQQGQVWGPLMVALGVLIAVSLSHWDTGTWLTYHALVIAWAVGAWALLFASQYCAQSTSPLRVRLTPWVEILGGLAVLAALVGEAHDPLRPWLPSILLLAVSVLVANLAILKRRRAEVVVSALLLVGSALVVWKSEGDEAIVSFMATVVIGLSIASLAWTLLERFHRLLGLVKSEGSVDALPFARPFRHVAAVMGVAILAFMVLGQLLFQETALSRFAFSSLSWCALAMTTCAAALCFWDAKAVFVLPTTYALGLTTVLMSVLALDWHGQELQRAVMLSVAGFVMLAAFIQAIAPRLGHWREALRLPEPTPLQPPFWFAGVQTTVACVPLLLSLGVSLAHDALGQRLAAPLAVGLLCAAGVMLTRRAVDSWQSQLMYATLALGLVLATEIGWALIDPATSAPALHRWSAFLIALGVTTVGYGFVLPRLIRSESHWRELVRKTAPVIGLIACVTLVPVVLLEGLAYHDRHTPLAGLEVGAIALTIAGLVVAGIAFAIVPWADPFGLSEKRRRYYVYASELLLVFLFLHLRLNVPELFTLFGGKYWPFAVMALAFAGVGLSEFFRRSKLNVLAEPLRRTGVFLPLLPLLAIWVRPPEAVRDRLIELWPGSQPLLNYLRDHPVGLGPGAILWFLCGAVYALLAVTQRSFRYGLFAALAANVGFWFVWQSQDIYLLIHPQLWLIPLALIILVSETINREHISRELSTGLRYLGLGMLYLSSTADMFITGLGNSVWLPLILATLSIAGVLAGILFRVRSYLYLGVGFLVLVIVSMIWHAAVDLEQAWVWWVSGILLGAAILALFALFEKRRLQMAQVLEEFRHWR
jgi:hypothetical protein